MAKKEKKKRNWRDKYRFSVINDKTFEEVWKLKLTQYNAFLLIAFLLIFIVGGTATLIAFTNLREFIPGYPDVDMRKNILMSAIRLDSLDRELAIRDKYFTNLSSILNGGQPMTSLSSRNATAVNTASTSATADRVPSAGGSTGNSRSAILNQGSIAGNDLPAVESLHFFPPVKGLVSGHYNIRTKHFGTDIVTNPRAVVSSALDGTVIFTGWTMETGFVIEVQHPNNIISIYKHNASLLKETGDIVKAGESISVVGDSGEMYTSGPHLHFEIWYKGVALDPEKHILF